MQVEPLATATLRKYKMTGTIEPVSAAPSSKLLLQSRAPSKRPSPPPSGPLPFGVADVRAAIPAHCFERNTFVSLGYVALDLVIAGTLFTMSTYISMLPWWAQILAWPAYWYAQGSVLTGVWVLAHECGHGAFSASKTVCDVVGWVLHSALLVPYFSWKYTHAAHHRNTCSLENDEVFVPPTRSEFVKEMLSETPVANAIQIVLMLTLGWYVWDPCLEGFYISTLFLRSFAGRDTSCSTRVVPRSIRTYLTATLTWLLSCLRIANVCLLRSATSGFLRW